MPPRAASRRARRRRRISPRGTLSACAPPLDSGFLSRDTGLTAQWERAPVPGAQLMDLIADANSDGPAEALRVGDDRELAALERHSERGASELHRERQSLQPVGELGIEVEDPVANLASDEAALNQI